MRKHIRPRNKDSHNQMDLLASSVLASLRGVLAIMSTRTKKINSRMEL